MGRLFIKYMRVLHATTNNGIGLFVVYMKRKLHRPTTMHETLMLTTVVIFHVHFCPPFKSVNGLNTLIFNFNQRRVNRGNVELSNHLKDKKGFEYPPN